jgi:hypothetical protein
MTVAVRGSAKSNDILDQEIERQGGLLWQHRHAWCQIGWAPFPTRTLENHNLARRGDFARDRLEKR